MLLNIPLKLCWWDLPSLISYQLVWNFDRSCNSRHQRCQAEILAHFPWAIRHRTDDDRERFRVCSSALRKLCLQCEPSTHVTLAKDGRYRRSQCFLCDFTEYSQICIGQSKFPESLYTSSNAYLNWFRTQLYASTSYWTKIPLCACFRWQSTWTYPWYLSILTHCVQDYGAYCDQYLSQAEDTMLPVHSTYTFAFSLRNILDRTRYQPPRILNDAENALNRDGMVYVKCAISFKPLMDKFGVPLVIVSSFIACVRMFFSYPNLIAQFRHAVLSPSSLSNISSRLSITT